MNRSTNRPVPLRPWLDDLLLHERRLARRLSALELLTGIATFAGLLGAILAWFATGSLGSTLAAGSPIVLAAAGRLG